jgi:hypothetical protein
MVNTKFFSVKKTRKKQVHMLHGCCGRLRADLMSEEGA